MLKPTLCLLWLCLLLAACSKEDPQPNTPDPDQTEEPNPDPDPEPDPPVPVAYFTFRSDYAKPAEIVGQFVVVHDANGVLLDYKPYEPGQTLLFESTETISDLISVSLVRAYQYDYGKTHNITTTTAVTKGSEWIFENLPNTQDYFSAPQTGSTFNVYVNGIPGILGKWETNTLNELGGSGGTITYPGSPPQVNYNRKLNVFEGYPDYYMTILNGYQELKYLHFTYGGGDLTFDYSEMLDYDVQYAITLPENQTFYRLEVAGFNDDAPYHEYYGGVLMRAMSGLNPDVPTQPLNYGYLDAFNRYRTLLVTFWDNKRYTRLHYGPRVEQLEVPDPAFEVTDPSLKQFRYSTDATLERVTYSFGYSEGSGTDGNLVRTSWDVKVPAGYDSTLGDLPEELLTAYPDLHIDQLGYGQTVLEYPTGNGEFNSINALTIANQ